MPHFLTPLTEKATRWIEKNVVYESWQLGGDGDIAVDSRMVDDIADAMTKIGLAKEVDFTINS